MPPAIPAPAELGIDEVRDLIADQMTEVDALIRTRLHSDVVLINQLSRYVIGSGGKRLRPVLAILSARALGYGGTRHIDLAVIVELIHTATLLHDDVVDSSRMRRGRETANMVWGNEASVLVGDFLYSRAFQMMVDIGRMRVLEILADATNTIAEGEVMQLVNCNDPETTEERYLHTIRFKTAKLFEAAAQLGKNIGDDLAEGKPTLPLLYAMWQGTPAQAATIREAILEGGRDRIKEISAAIESTGAIKYTFALAEAEAAKARSALAAVPQSIYLDALQALTRFAVERQS